MPLYCYTCTECQHKATTKERYDDIWCPVCNGRMKRDYKAEGASNTFTPTVDRYAKKKGYR